MSQKKGDKARYNRQRRKNIARRATTRALSAQWTAEPKAATPAKTS